MSDEKNKELAYQLTLKAIENGLIRTATSRTGIIGDETNYSKSISNIISKTYLNILDSLEEIKD